MVISMKPALTGSSRTRAALAMAASAMALSVAFIGFSGTSSAKATYRSPCEDESAIGQVCHYVAIVSERPDYDASMDMIDNATNAPVPGTHHWEEHNPNYTRWYWRYDQNADSNNLDFHLHLRITIRKVLTGREEDISGGTDTCYQIRRNTNAVDTVACPTNPANP
jgi:hypothetical protein